MENVIENNQVKVIGTVISDFTFNHKVYGESFFIVSLCVKRLSAAVDVLPIMVSDRLIDVSKDYKGCTIEVSGQFRSYNQCEEGRNHLMLYVFAREINFLEEFTDYTKTNHIFLDGNICQETIYRETPLGREIANIMLAINRPYGKSDYIPCVAWGRNARFVSGFPVGTALTVNGRVQSREYTKKISDTEHEKRIAYEVSISKLEVKECKEER